MDNEFDYNFHNDDERGDELDPTGIDYIHVPGEDTYSPDCPACLRHLFHTDNDHYETLRRVYGCSSD